jgi:hypothetical protein
MRNYGMIQKSKHCVCYRQEARVVQKISAISDLPVTQGAAMLQMLALISCLLRATARVGATIVKHYHPMGYFQRLESGPRLTLGSMGLGCNCRTDGVEHSRTFVLVLQGCRSYALYLCLVRGLRACIVRVDAFREGSRTNHARRLQTMR